MVAARLERAAPAVSEYVERVNLHLARGCEETVAFDAARLSEARVPLRKWEEMLHPRNRVGEFMPTDAHGNPVEPHGGGGFVGSRPPAMTSKQVAKVLRKAGFERAGQRGSHAVFKHPQGGRKVVVPMHGSRAIPRGTLMSIFAAAGAVALTEADFTDRLHLRDRMGRFRDMPDLLPSGAVRWRSGGLGGGVSAVPKPDTSVAHDVRYTGTPRPGGSAPVEPDKYADLSPLHRTWRLQDDLDRLQEHRSSLRYEMYTHSLGGKPQRYVDGGERLITREERDTQADLDAVEAKITPLAQQVEKAQQAAGGRVFRVPDQNIEDLRARVEKLNKRAKKIGVPPVGVNVTDDTWQRETRDSRRGTKLVVPYRFVVISGATPKYEGWQFAATLDRTEGKDEVSGIVIRRVPSLGDNDDSYIASLDLDHYRHSANHCDQCGYNRRRNHTYVVANQEKGEVKQVGSECVKDFLGGQNPDAIAKSAEWLRDLVDEFGGEDREDGFGGGHAAVARPATEDYLAHVALMIRTEGYKARWRDGYREHDNTADHALSNLWNMHRRNRARDGSPLWIEPEQQDFDKAQASLEWVRENIVPKTDKSEFEHNLSIYAGQAYLGERGEGFVAYIPQMHTREVEKQVKQQAREDRNATAREQSEYVGKPGERMKFDRLTVTRVGTYEGNYGTTYPTNFEDDHGNQYLWWASKPLELGGIYTFMARVKSHDVDRYTQAKTTQVTRPTKIVLVDHRVQESEDEDPGCDRSYTDTVEMLRERGLDQQEAQDAARRLVTQ
jgi:predicted RNA binding protein YcfA (HicA-like mRNA interferase family)